MAGLSFWRSDRARFLFSSTLRFAVGHGQVHDGKFTLPNAQDGLRHCEAGTRRRSAERGKQSQATVGKEIAARGSASLAMTARRVPVIASKAKQSTDDY